MQIHLNVINQEKNYIPQISSRKKVEFSFACLPRTVEINKMYHYRVGRKWSEGNVLILTAHNNKELWPGPNIIKVAPGDKGSDTLCTGAYQCFGLS